MKHLSPTLKWQLRAPLMRHASMRVSLPTLKLSKRQALQVAEAHKSHFFNQSITAHEVIRAPIPLSSYRDGT
jgi:hypothetical protein